MLNINAQVRRCKVTGWFTIFYIDEYNACVSFCFQEGHNIACDDYRLKSCEVVSIELQKEFLAQVQKYYDSLDDSRVNLKLVQKLKREA